MMYVSDSDGVTSGVRIRGGYLTSASHPQRKPTRNCSVICRDCRWSVDKWLSAGMIFLLQFAAKEEKMIFLFFFLKEMA